MVLYARGKSRTPVYRRKKGSSEMEASESRKGLLSRRQEDETEAVCGSSGLATGQGAGSEVLRRGGGRSEAKLELVEAPGEVLL